MSNLLDKLPQVISFAVFLIAIGYAAGNARKLNFWHILLILFVIGFFVSEFDGDKPMIYTLLGSLLFGYLLPQAGALKGFGESISEFINNIRYRSAYEDIRRKEEEVEELRKRYEQERRDNQRNEEYEQAKQRRKQESENFRKRSQEKQSSSNHESSSSEHPTANETRKKHLRTLKLDPERGYSEKEIKQAFRRQANKCHPDKFAGQSEEVIKKAQREFCAVSEAFERLISK